MKSRRILVVDNDKSVLDELKDLLQAKGYMVFTAEDETETKEILQRQRIHLAIIDMRLTDHSDEKDTSGIKLAEEIDPIIHKIIFTAYPDYESMHKAIKDVFPDYRGKTRIKFPGVEEDFLNPVIWLNDRRFDLSTYHCRTHGDLNGKNILVDEDGHPWLIDFFRTGFGHILRDFVELEADIKFNYLETSNIEALYEFEKSLVGPKKFDEPYNFESNISELDKAFAVIKGLRELAHSVIEPSNDIREYYIGLLYHTVNIIRYNNIKKERARHALLSAALICERLEKW